MVNKEPKRRNRGQREGENSVVEEAVAPAEEVESRGVKELRPPAAHGGDVREGGEWDPGEDFVEEVIREGGNGGFRGGSEVFFGGFVGVVRR